MALFHRGTFRVFVSSTFSDFTLERNGLERRVFPRLQQLCESHGCSFQAIDLRWGISEAASRQQRAMRICLDEIDRCKTASPRPNFICLLGDRYGFRPIPDSIPTSDFESILAVSAKPTILTEWYQLDTNAVPAEYVLRHPELEDAGWEATRESIVAALDTFVGQHENTPEGSHNYGCSATEQEIKRALEPGDQREHVLAYVRTIRGLPIGDEGAILDPGAAPFVDELLGKRDPIAMARLESLVGQVRDRLGVNVHDYAVDWHDGLQDLDLNRFCDDVYESLEGIIRKEIEQLVALDPLVSERARHDEVRNEYSRSFVGRTEELDRLGDYIKGESPYPMIITGDIGCGKSSLLARSATMAIVNKFWTVFRFVGQTPSSASESQIIGGILGDVASQHPATDSELPGSRDQLLDAFANEIKRAASKEPLVIFVDGVDELDSPDFSWLLGRLPPKARMIISVRQGTSAALEILAKTPEDHCIILAPLSGQETSDLLDAWLSEVGRKLTSAQHNALMLAAHGRSALYLRTSFASIRWLCSWEDVPFFADDLQDAVRRLIAYLASNDQYGPVIVRAILALLTSARFGLSEDELIELLSRDNEVFDDFLRRAKHSPPSHRLPIILFSRIRFDLSLYLTEGFGAGKPLIRFFHSSIAETLVKELPEGATDAAHEAIARLFESQPVCFSSNGAEQPNLRKLQEQVFQQARSKRWDQLVLTLNDPQFLDARSCYGEGLSFGIYNLIDDCVEANVAQDHIRDPIALLRGALQENLSLLRREPSLVLQEICNSGFDEAIVIKARTFLANQNRSWFCALDRGVRTNRIRVIDRTIGAYSSLPSCASTEGTTVVLSRSGGIEFWSLESGRRIHRIPHATQESPVYVRLYPSNGEEKLIAFYKNGLVSSWHLANASAWVVERQWKAGALWQSFIDAPIIVRANFFPDHGVATTLHALPDERSLALKLVQWSEQGEQLFDGDLGFAAEALAYGTVDGAPTLAVAGREFDREATGLEAQLAQGAHDRETGRMIESRWHGPFEGSRLMLSGIRGGKDMTTPVPYLGPLVSVAWGPDVGKTTSIAVGDASGSIAVFSLADRETTFFPSKAFQTEAWRFEPARFHPPTTTDPIEGHASKIMCLAFSPDGKTLASASELRPGIPPEIRLWDLASQTQVARVPFETDVDSLVMLSSREILVCGPALMATVKIAETPSQESTDRIVDCAALSHNGRYLAYAQDADIHIRHDTGHKVIELAHLSEIRSLVWHPNDSRLGSLGYDGVVRVWNVETGQALVELQPSGRNAQCFSFTADGDCILIGSTDGSVEVFSLDGRTVKRLTSNPVEPVLCVASSNDGLIVSGTSKGRILMWNGPNQQVIAGHRGAVRAITFVGNILVSGGDDRTLIAWDVACHAEVRRVLTSRPIRSIYACNGSTVAIATAGSEAVSMDVQATTREAKLYSRFMVFGAAILPEEGRVRVVDGLGRFSDFELYSLTGSTK